MTRDERILAPVPPDLTAVNQPMIYSRPTIEQMVAAFVETLTSPRTRRAYREQIEAYLSFCAVAGRPNSLDADTLRRWLATMRAQGLSSASRAQALSAVKSFARRANELGLISDVEIYRLSLVKAGKIRRYQRGVWLSEDQARELINMPKRESGVGLRDAVVIGALLGCGFRRTEALGLTWGHVGELEGRMAWLGVVGKGESRRDVPIPIWAAADLRAWRERLRGWGRDTNADSRVLWSFDAIQSTPEAWRAHEEAADRATGQPGAKIGRFSRALVPLTQSGIAWIVGKLGERIGVEKLRPHDLRRSMAALARKNGADLEEIRMTLGHANVATTQVYLGGRLEAGLGRAAVDRVIPEKRFEPVESGA